MHLRLQKNIRELVDRIYQIPVDKLLYKSAPGKWSKKEILGHLVDSALNNLYRFLSVMYSYGDFRVRRYDQDYLVNVNKYQELDLEHLVNMWQSLNMQISNIIRDIPPKKLEQVIQINKTRFETVEWLIKDYVDHMEHHLNQIFDGDLDEPRYHITQEQAVEELKKTAPNEFITLLNHGDLEVEYYQPDKVDKQTPHEKDEIYVIASGSGSFILEENRYDVKEKDVLFVKAGQDHRFVDFTDDFATWVIFYGLKR